MKAILCNYLTALVFFGSLVVLVFANIKVVPATLWRYMTNCDIMSTGIEKAFEEDWTSSGEMTRFIVAYFNKNARV